MNTLKSCFIALMMITTPLALFTGCEEKSKSEQIKDSLRDAGDDIKDAGEDLKDAAVKAKEKAEEEARKAKEKAKELLNGDS